MNSSLREITNELSRLNIIAAPGELEIKAAKGTTEGQVYILCETGVPSYVLKLEEAEYTRDTAEFLARYAEAPLLPKLLYADPEHRYVVYEYWHGTTHVNRGAKRDWMSVLARGLLNHYTPERSFQGFGRPDSPCESWREFNRRSLADAAERIGGSLPAKDHELAERLWKERLGDWGEQDKYGLHGDTGVHNFVFGQGALAGVIDPSPIAGPILYDFTYAFCSSPDDLNVDTLLGAYNELNTRPIEPEEVILETAFQLYCRIAICMMHRKTCRPIWRRGRHGRLWLRS